MNKSYNKDQKNPNRGGGSAGGGSSREQFGNQEGNQGGFKQQPGAGGRNISQNFPVDRGQNAPSRPQGGAKQGKTDIDASTEDWEGGASRPEEEELRGSSKPAKQGRKEKSSGGQNYEREDDTREERDN